MLKIALPSGKSMQENTFRLFSEARIPIIQNGAAATVSFRDYPALSEGRLIKPIRIPHLVQLGVFDLGITGSDIVLESRVEVPVYTELLYNKSTDGRGEVVLFAHRDDPVSSMEEIPEGADILSEYPYLTESFFDGKQRVNVHRSPGSAEAEVPFSYRFGVAFSETGKSLRDNNLKKLGTLCVSTAVLIANQCTLQDKAGRDEIHALMLILMGAVEARAKVLVSMNVPEESLEVIIGMLPSLDSPTVARLALQPYYSLSSVVSKDKVNELIPRLLKAKARGIIIQPISSVIESW